MLSAHTMLSQANCDIVMHPYCDTVTHANCAIVTHANCAIVMHSYWDTETCFL